MSRKLFLIALCIALCALLPAAAGAQASIRIETQMSSTPNGKAAIALIVNGSTVVRLAKTQRNKNPLRALSAASSQLSSAFRRGRTSLHIEATDDSGRQFGIFLDGELLLLATDLEGKAWGADPQDLAITWMNNINDSLGIAAVAGRPEQNKPEAGISGAAQGSRAEGSGNSGLITSSGHRVFDPPAAQFGPQSYNQASDRVVITGDSSGFEIVREGIDNLIRNRNKLPPDSKIVWHSKEASARPGKNRQLELDWISSRPGGLADSRGRQSLTLENRSMHLPRESVTFFSNKPERISRAQLLYFSRLRAHQAGRLVFHHQNQSGSSLDFVTRLLNMGTSPASVHVIPGLAKPDVNTFYVGYLSAEKFWSNLNSGNGYVLEIPPGEQVFLVNQKLSHGSTASGYMTLSNLSDSELRLETMSVNHGSPVPPWQLESSGEASFCVFGEPFISADMQYGTGDNWMYLRLGNQLPQSSTDGTVLHGCYGMTHSFNVELRNTNTYPALIFVVLRASAGEVKGQFFLDDEFLGTSLVSSGEEQLLKDIPLRPGETKLLKIRAIPLNGGFYPASIIIREQRYP
jgi:hypothetical protein